MEWQNVGFGIAVLLAIPARSAAGSSEALERQALVVRTYDNFGVSGKNLEIARREAVLILGEAGVDASWVDCPIMNRTPAVAPAQCQKPLDANEVVLRIQAGLFGGGSELVSMGFAMVNVPGGPILATVYMDRVESVARGAGVEARALLGRAIAHEIGHLLLGTNQHASSGLMRAFWSRAELRRANGGDWHFLAVEARTMRTAIDIRMAVGN